jgi:plasmid rolling circle replication initiator protein Rep
MLSEEAEGNSRILAHPLKESTSTGEVLEDVTRRGKNRGWREKKLMNEKLAAGYGASVSFDHLQSRALGCSTYLRFAECSTGLGGHTKKLVAANFCHLRLCPMCAWRRSLKVASQVRLVCHTALAEDPKLRFVMLTLTIPNVSGVELGAAMTHLYASFDKLLRRKETVVVQGFFRALEITYNRERDDYHPHLHAILAVPENYFKHNYVKRERWLELWRESTGQPEIISVDVRSVRARREGGDALAAAAAEVGKYSVKVTDILGKNDAETAARVEVLHSALFRRKLVAWGGLLKQIVQQLALSDAETENADLVGASLGDCRCSICASDLISHSYKWLSFLREYVG